MAHRTPSHGGGSLPPLAPIISACLNCPTEESSEFTVPELPPSSTFVPADAHAELGRTVAACQARGLHATAVWASEYLSCISDMPGAAIPLETQDVVPPCLRPALLRAQSLFLAKEYLRCYHALAVQKTCCPLSLFLGHYALFMAGEVKKADSILEQGLQRAAARNPFIPFILSILSPNSAIAGRPYPKSMPCLPIGSEAAPLDGAKGIATVPAPECDPAEVAAALRADPFLKFFVGMCEFRAGGSWQSALEKLLDAVNAMPTLWVAWLEVFNVVTHVAHASTSFAAAEPDGRAEEPWTLVLQRLPASHWIANLVLANIDMKGCRFNSAFARFTGLSGLFPQAVPLITARATALYELKDYDAARALFDEAAAIDPFRLDDIDTFSNILFCRNLRAELAALAARAHSISKFRPEASVAIGNYLSLRDQHADALIQFQRAVRIDPTNANALTLLGHELVEMKQTKSAVRAYRAALEVNPRDYRTCYALGQTFEILHLAPLALQYFARAASLRPADPRMWTALGCCCQRLDRPRDAVAALQRAVACDEPAGLAAGRLAGLFVSLGRLQDAAATYEDILASSVVDGVLSESMKDACLFLSAYEHGRGNTERARQLCRRILETPGMDRTEAAKLLCRINSALPGRDVLLSES